MYIIFLIFICGYLCIVPTQNIAAEEKTGELVMKPSKGAISRWRFWNWIWTVLERKIYFMSFTPLCFLDKLVSILKIENLSKAR